MRRCFSSGSICQSHGSIDHHQPRTNTDHIPHWNLGSSFSAVCPRPCFLTLMLDGCACCSLHHPLPALISYQSIHVTAFFFPAGFSKKKKLIYSVSQWKCVLWVLFCTPLGRHDCVPPAESSTRRFDSYRGTLWRNTTCADTRSRS